MMKSLSRIMPLLLVCCTHTSAQEQSETPLQIVMRVADKVVLETSFKVELVQQGEGKNSTLKAVIPANASFRDHSYFEWHYSNGQMALAIIQLADATKNEHYAQFIDRYCSTTLNLYDSCKYRYEVLNEKKVFNYRLFLKGMLDNTSAAALPFSESAVHGESKATRFLVDEMANFIRHDQTRLDDGTLCRPDPQERTVWADDLFMSVPFLLRYGKLSGDQSCFDDAAFQIINFHKYLFEKKTGLSYHCWFDAAKKHGVAHWGRANGWMVWATTEALLHLPTSHRYYDEVVSIFRQQVKGFVKYQDENGMWHQVIDHAESYEETSCTAMFVLALARGIRNGWIEKEYEGNMMRGWNALKNHIADDGTVAGICQGTGIGETLDFYFQRKTLPHDPRGLGAVITAGVEVQLMMQQSKQE